MILLTAEERLSAEDGALEYLRSQGKVVGANGFGRRDIAYTVREFIAKAQLKKVVEWGTDICGDHPRRYTMPCFECPECIEALLKECE